MLTRRQFCEIGAVMGALVASAEAVVKAAWMRGLRPPPAETVSEWADRNYYLGPETPEPGLWHTSRTPYLKEPMDNMSPSSPVKSDSIMKGSQLGFTVGVAGGALAYIIAVTQSETLICLPDMKTTKTWVSRKLNPILKHTPALKNKIIDSRRRGSGNTQFLKEFASGAGALVITWSSSAAGLKSISARNTIFDEVDSFVKDADGEGHPITLAECRSTNFYDSKSLKLSTPSEQGSMIHREFLAGDQRYYFVPCKECRHYQILLFPNFNYEPKTRVATEIDQVWFQCVGCGRPINEYEKTYMLAAGEWIPTRHQPELYKMGFPAEQLKQLLEDKALRNETKVSRHLSRFYAPLGWSGSAWRQIACDWVEAQGDPAKLKTFTTHTLGEPWQVKGEAPDWQRLYDRREDYEIGVVPVGGYFLTCFVDVQGDRLEYNVKAWAPGKESWSVEYGVIPGDTATTGPFEQLELIRLKDWPTERGGTIPIYAMAIDSGFRPQRVYEFCENKPSPAYGPAGTRIVSPRTVFPTKGSPTERYKLIAGVSTVDAARKRRGIRIVSVGTSVGKEELYYWLKSLNKPTQPGEAYPAGYCHYPNYERDFFQGLCSEKRVVRSTGHVEWTKDPSVRNEPLDIEVGNRVCASLVGMDRFREHDWARFLPEVVRESPVITQSIKPQAVYLSDPYL